MLTLRASPFPVGQGKNVDESGGGYEGSLSAKALVVGGAGGEGGEGGGGGEGGEGGEGGVDPHHVAGLLHTDREAE